MNNRNRHKPNEAPPQQRFISGADQQRQPLGADLDWAGAGELLNFLWCGGTDRRKKEKGEGKIEDLVSCETVGCCPLCVLLL